jgi:hypothetical protein
MTPVYSYTRYQGRSTSESELADRLRARLKAEGLAYEDEASGDWRDCESIVSDPESSGGWTVELDACCPWILSVLDAHAERARQILAELST